MTQTTNTQHGTGDRLPGGQMYRPRDGRVVAGVALAVANRLGMSPGAVRLVWFILGWIGGLGVLLYLAGWLLIPEEGEQRSIAEQATSRASDATAWVGLGLIVIAVLMLVSVGGWLRGDWAWAVALLAVGILLYRGQLDGMFEPRHDGGGGGAVSEPDDVEEEAADEAEAEAEVTAATEELGMVTGDGAIPPAMAERAPVERAPRPRRERSMLGRLTIGTGFIALGVMAVLDGANVARPAYSHYLALFVGIIGLGLLVGSVIGRSRGLIFLGIVLVPFLLASSVVTARFGGGWGDPLHQPRSVAEVQDRYSLTGGDLELDLTRLDLTDEVLEIEGDLGFGRMLVLVPDGVGVSFTGHVGFGDLQVRGADDWNGDIHGSGIDVDRTGFFDGEGLLVLDLDVGFGQLEIREVSR